MTNEDKAAFTDAALTVLQTHPLAVLELPHFRSKYSQLLALLFIYQGCLSTTVSTKSHHLLFNTLITNLIQPNISNDQAFTSYSLLILDAIQEVYHY